MITFMNLIGAYLRYVPFSQELSENQINMLWKRLFCWSIFSTIILLVIFMEFEIGVFIYKIILFFIWIPYVLISFTVIKNKYYQHIFVMGMQGIWVLFLHTLSGSTIMVLQEKNFINKDNLAELELIFYFIFFVILLPAEKKLFINMLPSEEFFKIKRLSKYISILPLIMFIGYSSLMMNDFLFQTWSERISRLILLFVFFIIYRAIMATSKYAYENFVNNRNYQRLEQQLISLRDYNLFMQENQEKIAIMRHDLRHHYRLIYSLLENKEISKAMEHIKNQENLLDETRINKYCNAPYIINLDLGESITH